MPAYNSQVDALREVDENILRRIQTIHREQRNATVAEVTSMTGMTSSSVYTAIRRLEQNGDIEPYENDKGRGRGRQRYDLTLTEAGEARAAKILMRHDLVLSWLKRLGIPEEEAENEACHMEHGLTDNTLNIIKKHVDSAMIRMIGHSDMPCMKGTEPGGSQPASPEWVELLELAGNGENLAGLVKELRESGGIESSLQHLELLRELQKDYGGKDNLLVALNLLKRMGDLQALTQLLGVLESGGGVAAFIGLFEKERRIWINYLTNHP